MRGSSVQFRPSALYLQFSLVIKRLAIVHAHWRVGGVRSVISAGCGLMAECLRADEVVFLSGEPPPADWWAEVIRAYPALRPRWACHSAVGYAAESPQGTPQARGRDLAAFLAHEAPTDVWAHNLSLGRNPAVAIALEAWQAGSGGHRHARRQRASARRRSEAAAPTVTTPTLARPASTI